MPNRETKRKPRKLFKIMNEALDKFKNIFKKYAGGTLPDVTEPCDCQQCQIIIAAVKAKVQETPSKKEKYIMLTTLPRFVTVKDMVKDCKVSRYMAKKL